MPKKPVFILALLILAALCAPISAQLLLDDPLQGSTTGTRSGGSFVSGGWQVTGDWDYIFWHLPYPIANGAAEFYVTGLHDSFPHKTELFHMYDFTYGNADYSYNGGYRDSPHKSFIRKSGADYKNNTCELLWQDWPNYVEPDTAVLPWSQSANYKFRVEWTQEGSNTRFKFFRDAALIYEGVMAGAWNPGGHSVRIAASNRHAGEDAEVGAKYSNLKVWDLTNAVPAAPVVSAPANGETAKGPLAFIKWTGESHTQYQVRVCTANNPDTGIAWDSGQFTSGRDWTWTGALGNMTNYYVFVRLGSVSGWSNWSAAGRWFRIDNSFVGSNNTKLLGNSICDANGPKLGLGFSYMSAMRRCKYDRTRFNSDLAFMSARGFNYARILSMVGWYEAWLGKEIAPVGFTARGGNYVPAWTDYWQQFRDCIDIMYDTYGIRSEITIFADAQLMPTEAARYAHMDGILANLVGREHKVMHLEVANEAWQNGFPEPSGTPQLRAFCQYLADRTSIPVAITSNHEQDIHGLYDGSAADISTYHFSRDIGTFEGGWLPVRDPWWALNEFPNLPFSSNEPIGPGSSVSSENDPIKLVSAACFAYIANLPLYVYHTSAGVFGDVPFENMAGVNDFRYLDEILPPDVSSWTRNDGKETAAPFTANCNGVANRYWTDNTAGSDGCHRNIGGRKGIEFVCYPMGIRSGGLTLVARQQVTFRVYNPMTGAVVVDTTTRNTGEQLNLSAGPGAYIIKGAYGPSLPTGGGGSKTLNSKGQRTLTIDGNSTDWNLAEFTTRIRGGQSGEGDTALVGFDGGSLYYGSYAGVLPTNAADHTAKIYSRNDANYLYFLVRCDDSDLRYSNPTSANWANDCVEFYIDPGNDGGATAISNSTSDIQLVIDANNQKSVYMTTSGYATQVLAGVTSAVARDASGWWLEARIAKSAPDPDIPAAGGAFGLDFNMRDNDNDNDAALTTVYTWNDGSYSGFPSKIPSNWGDCFLDANQTPYSGVISVPGIVQAENYDIGGESISFHDTTSGNAGGQYRTDDVDMEACSDTGSGYNVGWGAPGEWLEYAVNAANSGDYSIKARVASGGSGGSYKMLMDGADVTGARPFAGTGGWQNWTSITTPSVYLAAGQHVMRFVWESGDFNLNNTEIISRGPDAVSIDLGSPDVNDGMTHLSMGDGNTIGETIGGHYCRKNTAPPADGYMYFTVPDTYAYQGNKPDVYITVDYYDTGSGWLTLHYDAVSTQWMVGASCALTGSNTWKTYTWHVTDAYFGNRENYGADFRIAGPGGSSVFYLDTVVVQAGLADTTPPAPVTGLKAYGGNVQVSLTWTNPTTIDFAGVKILAKTSGYPTSVADGSEVYTGNATNCAHGSLINGVKYYYSAFAFDGAPNYSTAANATAHAAADTNIPTAKGLADGQIRALRGSVVTAVFPGYFYIQDPAKPFGLRVSSPDTVIVGNQLDLVGAMAGAGAERYVDCAGNTVKVTAVGPIPVDRILMNSGSAGGVTANAYAPGVVSGVGPNSLGLRTTVCGKVTQRRTVAPAYFYIDDGCGVRDGTTTSGVENIGVRVSADPAIYPAGSYIGVTGVVSCFNSGGILPQLLPTTIQTLLAP